MVKGKKLVPPDGGWGWVVVFGVSVINLCTRSLEQCFGLLFADLFTELKIETTGAAAIASGLDVLVNFSGLLVGPLIRIYSYRTVSVMGTALCSLGLLLTVPAKSMGHIFVTYSIITGFGVGLAVSSTFVAVSNYFVDRRGVAVGLSLAGTAVGMVIMPHAVRLLLETYFFRGTTLILGAFAMHGIVGSMLLQPVENHLVPAKVQLEEGEYVQEMETIKEHEEENPDVPEGKTLLTKNFSEVTIKNAEDNPKQNMTRKATFPRNFSTVSVGGAQRRRKTSMESMISSYSRLDFTGSSIQMNIDATEREFDETARHQPFGSALRMRGALSKDEPKRTLLQKFVDFMDLDLLKCPIYLNLVFCLSISFVAEQNFKAVLPFFFDDLGYTKQDIANFLSIQSFADIIARSCLPPICDRINWTKKSLCFWCILSMGLSRSLLASQTNYTAIIICLLICGFIRGAAIVNFTITIAEYTTQKFSNLDKLASAYGLHMVGKGLASVMLGPLLGYIRDTTHSYPICIHSETCLLVTSCIAWAVEYTIIWCRQKNKSTIAATTT